MNKKVLILGGAGFIGFHLAKYLAKKGGYEITLADNFMKKNKDVDFQNLLNNHPEVQLIEADFTNPKSFDLLEKKYDHFYMMAALVGVDNANNIPHEVIRINTALTLHALEWAKQAQIGRAVFASTSENYAGTTDTFNYPVPTHEEVPLTISDVKHPRWTYAITKMLGESGFIHYATHCGFETTIVRYHNVFGPRMGFNHVVPHLVIRFRRGDNPFKVYGGDQTRDFCYVSDAVIGTIKAMEVPGISGNIYHLGTGIESTIRELTEFTGQCMHYQGTYIDAPTYPGSVSRRCPDISKSQRELNFKAVTSWKHGIQETVDWYNDYFDRGGVIPHEINFL